jgi:hypothetical protein
VRRLLWIASLASAAGLAAFLWFTSRRGKLSASIKSEVAAAKAAWVAAEAEAERGADAARAEVEARHKAELDALDERQREEAKELAEDPAELARFLVRVGRRGA